MYTAVSVVAALKENNALSCEGIDNVACPSVPSETHRTHCLGNFQICDLCKNQKCEQRIKIHQNLKLLRILVLRFVLSPHNPIGFIHKTDSVLLQLIRHNLIDKNKLISA